MDAIPDTRAGHEQSRPASYDRVDGRIALVTGASRGIGEATARRLAEAGATVVLVARGADRISELADEIGANTGTALAIPADMTAQSDLDTMLSRVHEKFGRLDILVNNAGVLPPARRAEKTSLAEWTAVLGLNLTAPWYLATRAREMMSAGSVVVNISSTAAQYPSIGLAPYNVSKAGLNTLTRVLALEWARAGIRVVGIAPGKVDTELGKPVIEYTEKQGRQVNPMNRLGRPEEIADLVAFLVSDRASYITGSIHTVDGGELLDVAPH